VCELHADDSDSDASEDSAADSMAPVDRSVTALTVFCHFIVSISCY